MKPRSTVMVPKLLVNNDSKSIAPFIDATGSHAGALLGDVRHDPYQSGGLGTPAHERVEAGMIHSSNKGVLYIDEIGTMQMKTQQELLTAMQEKKYSITGQSEQVVVLWYVLRKFHVTSFWLLQEIFKYLKECILHSVQG